MSWAPYAGNAVIILALATILNIMARGLPLWMRLMLFLLALALPISQNAVNEFRPDIASPAPRSRRGADFFPAVVRGVVAPARRERG